MGKPELERGHNVSAYLNIERAQKLQDYMKKNKVKKPNTVVLKALDNLFEPLLDPDKK